MGWSSQRQFSSLKLYLCGCVCRFQTKSSCYNNIQCSLGQCGLPGDRAVSPAAFFGLQRIRLPGDGCTIPAALWADEAIMSEMNYGPGFVPNPPVVFHQSNFPLYCSFNSWVLFSDCSCSCLSPRRL